MNWNKLNPWNWFKKENTSDTATAVQVNSRNTPAHPLVSMHRELDRMFDTFMSDSRFPSLPDNFGFRSPTVRGLLKPSVDISENKDSYTIRAEIPGVDREEIKLQVEGDTLIVSGEKKQEKESNEGGYHCVERSYGTFRRVLSLPEDADANKVSAKFKNGVLTLTVPRSGEAKKSLKNIEIT